MPEVSILQIRILQTNTCTFSYVLHLSAQFHAICADFVTILNETIEAIHKKTLSNPLKLSFCSYMKEKNLFTLNRKHYTIRNRDPSGLKEIFSAFL